MANLVAIAYDDVDQAQQVMGTLGELVRKHTLELEDAVVVEHRPGGKMKLHQPSLAGRGAVGGAIGDDLFGAALSSDRRRGDGRAGRLDLWEPAA